MGQLFIGTGKIGPRLFLCILMDYDSRMILDYEFGSVNSDKLKQKLCSKRGLNEIPPTSRCVSALFASLSAEEMSQYIYRNNDERMESAANWIRYYNTERIHASLNYKTPEEVYLETHSSLN